MFFTRDYQPEKHLKLEDQERIADQLESLAAKQPLSRSILFLYAEYLTAIPSCAFSFVAWRAGWRGYNLRRFNKGRLTTVALAILYPVYGVTMHQMGSKPKITEPYRRENLWYHGSTFGLYQVLVNLSIMSGTIGSSYVCGSAYGMINIPGKGWYRPSKEEFFYDMILKGLKPYGKGLFLAALGTAACAFAIGAGSYYQSCSLLAMMNRKSLGLKESSEVLPM